MNKDYIIEAMDYIIKETRWADKFPDQCHERIRLVCKAVKNEEPLPFLLDNKEQNQ